MVPTALISIGGNSLVRPGEHGTIAEQRANARRTAKAIVQIIRTGFRVVVTHGNGPQVGAALLRSERSSDQVYCLPLDVCDATTQGEVGYLLQQALQAELAEAGQHTLVATVITQVVVSPTDPAMGHATKQIGPFYSKLEAETRHQQFGWSLVEDAERGYRRVVPSPEPLEIVEEGVIRRLIETGVLVIAVGGGGIPVVRCGSALRGVEAVIDKDRASALLAARLETDYFIISTDVDRVCLNFRKRDQVPLGRVTAAELESHYLAGQFPPGNMGPKVESALRFLRDGGREVIITSSERLLDAVGGSAGTHVVP
jgi:carbamate kinase